MPQDAAGFTSRMANEKLDLAVIGVGGRGGANLGAVAKENIVALCDVDEKRAAKSLEKFPRATRFRDFRKMFDALEGKLDGVVISTPDHTHFHPALWALQRKLHVYLEKPLAHSVWETRHLTELAAKQGVATQLGVQRHTIPNVHRVVELIQSGAIGPVREVHSWVTGARGMPGIPKDKPPVPKHLDWPLWLGPAEDRPYHPSIAPYGWRFWWDYGTGETGNWGCHTLDLPYWALDLRYPDRVEAEGPPVDPRMTPKAMAVRYRFPARGERPPVTLHWSHVKNGPAILREHGLPAKGNNTLFVGDKGMLLCGFGQRRLYPEKQFADHEAPAPTIPDSPGFHREWLAACRGGAPRPTCDFSYSGPLTETVLLGNVAYRAGGGFEWDAESLTVKGSANAAAMIRTPFRKGWET